MFDLDIFLLDLKQTKWNQKAQNCNFFSFQNSFQQDFLPWCILGDLNVWLDTTCLAWNAEKCFRPFNHLKCMLDLLVWLCWSGKTSLGISAGTVALHGQLGQISATEAAQLHSHTKARTTISVTVKIIYCFCNASLVTARSLLQGARTANPKLSLFLLFTYTHNTHTHTDAHTHTHTHTRAHKKDAPVCFWRTFYFNKWHQKDGLCLSCFHGTMVQRIHKHKCWSASCTCVQLSLQCLRKPPWRKFRFKEMVRKEQSFEEAVH